MKLAIPLLVFGQLLGLGSSSALFAQQEAYLSVVETASVPKPEHGTAAFVMPVKCDAEDNIYLEFAGFDLEPAVTIVSADRRKASYVALRGSEAMVGSILLDFAPVNGGDVVVLAQRQQADSKIQEYYLATYKNDGSLSALSRLNTDNVTSFEPKQIATLSNDAVVIAGFELSTSRGRLLLYKPDGQFIREVVLHDDDFGEKGTPIEKLEEVADLSALQSSGDGNVYLVRRRPTGPVFVISSGGQVQRIALKPPQDDAELLTAKVSGDNLVAEYVVRISQGHNKVLLVTTSLKNTSITKIAHFDPTAQLGMGLACNRHGVLEFLTVGSAGQLAFARAVIQ